MAVAPPRRNPPRMRTWRHLPSALLPHVVVSIPSVKSRNPDVVPARSRSPLLDKDFRRGKLHHNVRCLDSTNSESQCKQYGRNESSHHVPPGRLIRKACAAAFHRFQTATHKIDQSATEGVGGPRELKGREVQEEGDIGAEGG